MDFVKLKGVTIKERIAEYESVYRVERPIEERPARRHVEETFDAFVREFGEEKISDRIENKSQMPLNADYIFDQYNIVAELKTLEGIYSGPDSFALLEQALIDAGRPDVNIFDLLFGGQTIPTEVSKLVSRRTRRSIEQRVKVARKQLRQSKRSFGNQSTQTLIIFAIDQIPLFGHHNILMHISRLMGDNYADEFTDGIVYIHPNTPTQIRSDGMEFSGWYPLYRDDQVSESLSSFVNILGNRWLKFYAAQIGIENPILEIPNPEDILEILRPLPSKNE